MSKRRQGWVYMLFGVAAFFSFPTTSTYADTLQSPHYQFDDSTLGSGGLVESSSNSYKGSSAVGDIAVGDSSSTNYQVDSGSKTTPDPTLSFSVDTTGSNFGNFSSNNAAMATAHFSVSNYTSYGYAVQIVGPPPTNGSHTIKAMTADTSTADAASQPGQEQFGINLVANTSPKSIGSNPDNGQFGYGTIATNYDTANKYRYVSGETIASAPKSSGVTNYTISYLVNVGNLTPGGQYTSNQTLVVTGTY